MDTDPTTYAPLAKWATEAFSPEFERRVNAAPGHLAARYIDFVGETPNTGVAKYQSTPRFSTAYVNLQNRPALLIEMPTRQRLLPRETGKLNYRFEWKPRARPPLSSSGATSGRSRRAKSRAQT